MGDKTDLMVPIDVKYVAKFRSDGTMVMDWPEKMGFAEGSAKGITEETLPTTWDRYGRMTGKNFSDIPESGRYTTSQRALAYFPNEAAYHSGQVVTDSYFAKIDAIKDGDLEALNSLLEAEGKKKITSAALQDYQRLYNNNIANMQSVFGNSFDVTYGIAGTAAAWHNLEGGASQFVFPLNGETLVELGIFTVNKKGA